MDETSRYRNAIYPAKLWATYAAPGLEVTAGDAYVQFGRGLTLSMRKIDELGIDTTVRGGKIEWQADPFAATLVGGLANPNRVDGTAARTRSLPSAHPPSRGPSQPSAALRVRPHRRRGDRRRTWAPRDLSPPTPSAFIRCAPYAYDSEGRILQTGAFDLGIGSCAASDTAEWLSSLTTNTNPLLNAKQISMVGQGLEVPDLGGHGQVYLRSRRAKTATARGPTGRGTRSTLRRRPTPAPSPRPSRSRATATSTPSPAPSTSPARPSSIASSTPRRRPPSSSRKTATSDSSTPASTAGAFEATCGRATIAPFNCDQLSSIFHDE